MTLNDHNPYLMRSKRSKKNFFEEPDEFPGEETQPYVFLYRWNDQNDLPLTKQEEPEQPVTATKPAEKEKSFFRRMVAGFFSL